MNSPSYRDLIYWLCAQQRSEAICAIGGEVSARFQWCERCWISDLLRPVRVEEVR